jgi:hypothetical protein
MGALQRGDIELDHLQHRGHRPPPFSAMKRWPAGVKSTTSTVPAFPEGPSTVFLWTFSILESGSSET